MNLIGLSIATFVCLSFCALAEKPSPTLTEVWSPIPAKVTYDPASGNKVPSDAIPLLSATIEDPSTLWKHKNGTGVRWHYKEGEMTIKPKTGSLFTQERFCDIQLHLEWRAPTTPERNHANSGIKIQGRYEVQILETYGKAIYVNGQAGAIYKQSAPLVNALSDPGQWQTYDIIFTAPRFSETGELQTPAYVTVLHNGILIQNHFALSGTTLYVGQPSYPKAHGCEPLMLQDHGDAVSFRNMWIRKL